MSAPRSAYVSVSPPARVAVPLALAGPRAPATLGERDAEWVARLVTGDEGAFEAIFRAYYEPIRGYVAHALGSSDAGDEVAQEIMVAVWEGRARLAGIGDLHGYLFRAARNRIANRVRHDRVVQRGTDAVCGADTAPGMGARPADVDIACEHREFADAVRREVGRLSPRCREAYTLRWVHQLSRAEIARTMGITVKGVEIQLTRAMRSLREALKEFG